jgi:orotidine-5'-phosphate decarboxylase
MSLNANKIIVALDYSNKNEAVALVKRLKKYISIFKVGFELFLSCGSSIIKEINEIGGKVFLDLKLHDIPNTVMKSSKVIADMNVFMFNLHTSGGFEMMKRTMEEIKKSNNKPIVVGVTVLTSLNSNILSKELSINCDVKEQVLRLAKLAKLAGLDGVVASGEEISDIKRECGSNFKVVVAGVRPLWFKDKDDQKRIITPKEAIEKGADFIVIGRPITRVDNPEESAKKIIKEVDS